MVRGQILTIKQNEYVLAAKVSGANREELSADIFFQTVSALLLFPQHYKFLPLFFTESFLSFVGLGVQAPMPSLGSLANAARAGYFSVSL